MLKTITVEDGDRSITVSEASALIGMRRQRLRVEGQAAGETDPDRRFLRLVQYPDVVAATVTQAGFDHWSPSFDEFIEWPERFLNEVEEAIYRLNPHWVPGYDSDEAKKKDDEMQTD